MLAPGARRELPVLGRGWGGSAGPALTQEPEFLLPGDVGPTAEGWKEHWEVAAVPVSPLLLPGVARAALPCRGMRLLKSRVKPWPRWVSPRAT